MADDAPLSQLASACAARMSTPAAPFHTDLTQFRGEYDALLDAVRQSGDRFAFDRTGRPEAIAAVREALPAMERELFDAVLDDLACEIAATQEAMYRIIAALRSPRLGHL